MKKLLLFALILSGLITSAQDTITGNGCYARFKYAVNYEIMTLLPSTPINFHDRSEGNVIQWSWDFGDGYTSDEQEPLHIFEKTIVPDGSLVKINPYRTVTLTITTSDSCVSSYSEIINIYDGTSESGSACEARWKYSMSAYDSVGGTASFKIINQSVGESLSYSWYFDNGKESTEAEPEVTFDLSQSERKVCLTISGDNECVSTFCDAIYVNSNGDGASNPDSIKNSCFVAFGYTINYEYQTFAPALVLDFYTKSNDEIVKYLWDFGDGNISNEPNPTHGFNLQLNFDSVLVDPNPFRMVCLTVTTASGCETSFCDIIDIYKGYITIGDQCHAWFKAYVPSDVITIPEVVPYQFVNGSEGNIVSWLWQFEDGTTRTESEPLVMFDIFKPTQNVCLTVTTADSCTSSQCEIIYVSPQVIDTNYVVPVCNYTFNYTSSYPPTASACIGTATAQVVFNDSLIDTEYYYWTDGNSNHIADGAEVNNLCPTQIYTVTALTTDGCKFSGSFIFNSDGTISEIPINWWVTNDGGDWYLDYDIYNSEYTVEWVLCDGTVITGDSILLNKINCGSAESNLIVRDAAGNTIYTEKIALKTGTTSNEEINAPNNMKLYPVPVADVLNVAYNNQSAKSFSFEISDINGRTLLKQNYNGIKTSQHLSVDVSALQKGIYFGKIISENKIIAIEKFNK